MLHNQGLKSKGEKQQWRDANVIQTKRKAQTPAFLLVFKGLQCLVSFLANECRDIEIIRAPLHHRSG